MVTLSLGQRNVYFLDRYVYVVKGLLWHSDPISPKFIVVGIFFL
jgi:hypothetical protein